MARTRYASLRQLFRRFRWDLLDRLERRAWAYWLIWQVPGLFGDMLRGRYLSSRMRSCGADLRVMAGCRFRSLEKLEVGDNVSIGFDNFLQAHGGLRLGNHVVTAPGVKIWSVNHEYDDPEATVYEQGQEQKSVMIGDDVFIGSNAFIMPGVTLPQGCVVSAGAVVGVKAYRPRSILAGNPARVIGYRGGDVPALPNSTEG